MSLLTKCWTVLIGGFVVFLIWSWMVVPSHDYRDYLDSPYPESRKLAKLIGNVHEATLQVENFGDKLEAQGAPSRKEVAPLTNVLIVAVVTFIVLKVVRRKKTKRMR